MRSQFYFPQKYLRSYFFIYYYMPRRKVVNLAHDIHGSGNGVPIIVMHGLLGSKRNWRSMSENLATELKTTVVNVDLRNHGDSPHALPHTYPELALDIAQLIDKFGFDKVNLIGHSMGGRTAMVLALTQGIKVHSLVVVDISPIATSSALSEYFPRALSLLQSLKFNGMKLDDARKMTANKLLEFGLAHKQEDAHFINTNLYVKNDKTVSWKCNVDALHTHFEDIASFPVEVMSNQFSGRALFIGGQQSNFIPPEDLPLIQKMFPAAQLKYVDGAGHNVHFDAAKAFLNLVVTFLKET